MASPAEDPHGSLVGEESSAALASSGAIDDAPSPPAGGGFAGLASASGVAVPPSMPPSTSPAGGVLVGQGAPPRPRKVSMARPPADEAANNEVPDREKASLLRDLTEAQHVLDAAKSALQQCSDALQSSSSTRVPDLATSRSPAGCKQHRASIAPGSGSAVPSVTVAARRRRSRAPMEMAGSTRGRPGDGPAYAMDFFDSVDFADDNNAPRFSVTAASGNRTRSVATAARRSRTTGYQNDVSLDSAQASQANTPQHAPDQETPGAERSDNDAARTVGSEDRRQRKAPDTGFLQSHPLVVAADAAYVSASVIMWGLAVAGLALGPDSGFTLQFVLGMAACQVVTAAWLVLHFFTQVRTGSWEIVAKMPDIRRHYRRGWFVFDAVSVAPIDFLLLFAGPTAFYAVSLRQLVRSVRFVQLGQSTNPLRESRMWMQLHVFLHGTAFVVHVVACTFMRIEDLAYLDALYLTSSTMTSVGYGDIVPSNTNDSRGVAIAIMFAGVGLVASVTAFGTSALTSNDALEQSAREKKQMLASMLEYFRIPWDEQIEIINLFPTALDAENVREFTQLVQSMPAFVVERVEGYTRAKALSSAIPLFSELPLAVMLELTSNLHQRFSQANEEIISVGAEGYEMFFLVRGVAEVVVKIGAEDVVVQVLRSGTYFGEVALIRDTTRTASVVSVGPCELLVLSRPDFKELTEKHEVLRQRFLDDIFKRYNLASQECSEDEGSTDGGGQDSADGDASLVDEDSHHGVTETLAAVLNLPQKHGIRPESSSPGESQRNPFSAL